MPTKEKILLDFQAETKDAVRDLNKLDKGLDKTGGSGKKTGDLITAGMVKAAAGIAGAVLAIKELGEAAQAAGRFQTQLAQTGALQYKRLQQATTGLLNEQQALTLAVKLNNGAFKVNQEQAELAAKAAVILGQQEGDLEKALDKVTQALVEGNIEALKEFGIQAEGSSDTISGFGGNLDALNKLLAENADFADRAGTEAQRAGASWSDAMSELQRAVGEVAIELAPAVQLLSELIGLLVTAFKTWKEFYQASITGSLEFLFGDTTGGVRNAQAKEGLLQIGSRSPEAVARREKQAKEALAPFNALLQQGVSTFVGASQKYAEQLKKEEDAKRKAANASRALAQQERARADAYWASVQARGGTVDIAAMRERSRQGDVAAFIEAGGGGTIPGIQGGSLILGGLDIAPAAPAPRETTQEELSEQARAMVRNSEAAQMFMDSANNAFSAWTSGAVSAGKAVKMFTGQFLQSVAARMFAKSLEEAATGVAMLYLAPAASATHFKAAAMYGAGAVAIGALARQFGGGSSTTSLPGAAAGPAGRASLGAPGRREVIVVGGLDPFDDDPRSARKRVADLFDRAAAENDSGRTVVHA